MPASAPNEFEPSVRFLPNSRSALIRGATLTTPRVGALGVVLFFFLTHSSSTMMLAFFPNNLDLLSRVAANLVDEYPLGAMTTFRVTAPGVVSTT
jgi:hypothetical protein